MLFSPHSLLSPQVQNELEVSLLFGKALNHCFGIVIMIIIIIHNNNKNNHYSTILPGGCDGWLLWLVIAGNEVELIQ